MMSARHDGEPTAHHPMAPTSPPPDAAAGIATAVSTSLASGAYLCMTHHPQCGGYRSGGCDLDPFAASVATLILCLNKYPR